MPKTGFFAFLAAVGFTAAVFTAPARAESPARPLQVAVTVKPVHSLVAAVMEGIGSPALLVPAGDSPHTHAVRPSEARVIENADLVFWVGPMLETSYAKPLRALARGRIVTLTETPGLELLPVRAAGIAAHGDRGEEAGSYGGKPAGIAIDPHIWLDPVNAKAIVSAIADALAAADSQNAGLYRANAAKTQARLDELDGQIKAEVGPVRDIPFLTYHDAYQYFEWRYRLADAGAIAISPEQQPGAGRLRALRKLILANGVVCVFTEPQFEPALARTLVAGTKARLGTLDPESRLELPPGPDFYFGLMRGLARDLRDCLAASGG